MPIQCKKTDKRDRLPLSRRTRRMACAGLLSVVTIAASAGAVVSSAGKLPKLDKAIDLALRQNPDVVLAESNVRSAQAELNAVRLQVSRDLAGAYAERREHEQRIEHLRQQLARNQVLYREGRIPQGETTELMIQLAAADGTLASIDARIRYLIGDGGRAVASDPSSSPKALKRRGWTADQAELLESKLTLSFEDAAIEDVLAAIEVALGGKVKFGRDVHGPGGARVSIAVEDMTLGQVLSLLADSVYMAFVKREYGFMVTSRDAAMQTQAPAFPEDLPVTLRGN